MASAKAGGGRLHGVLYWCGKGRSAFIPPLSKILTDISHNWHYPALPCDATSVPMPRPYLFFQLIFAVVDDDAVVVSLQAVDQRLSWEREGAEAAKITAAAAIECKC